MDVLAFIHINIHNSEAHLHHQTLLSQNFSGSRAPPQCTKWEPGQEVVRTRSEVYWGVNTFMSKHMCLVIFQVQVQINSGLSFWCFPYFSSLWLAQVIKDDGTHTGSISQLFWSYGPTEGQAAIIEDGEGYFRRECYVSGTMWVPPSSSSSFF